MNVTFGDVPGDSPVPDVDALMRRVRAGVADKLRRGVYALTDLEEVRRIERGLHERADLGPAPVDDIARLHSSWDLLGPHPFTSHRVGVGRLIVMAKRFRHRIVKPAVAATQVRQAQFNGAVARLLTGATYGVQSLEAGNDVLLRKLDELERRSLALHARCDELQAEVRGLQERLEPDGHAVKPA